jgi:hypothetical protein
MGYRRKNKKNFPVPVSNVTTALSRFLDRPAPAERPGFRSWEDETMEFRIRQEIVAFFESSPRTQRRPQGRAGSVAAPAARRNAATNSRSAFSSMSDTAMKARFASLQRAT